MVHPSDSIASTYDKLVNDLFSKRKRTAQTAFGVKIEIDENKPDDDFSADETTSKPTLDSSLASSDGASDSLNEDSPSIFDKVFGNPDSAALEASVNDVKDGKWLENVEQSSDGLTVLSVRPQHGAFAAFQMEENANALVAQLKSKVRSRIRERESLKELFNDHSIYKFMSLAFTYKSVIDTQRTPSSAHHLGAIAVHISNHILSGRDRVLRNNAKLAALEDTAERPDLRDQGFCRTRAIVVLPTRNYAFIFVNYLLQCLDSEQQENKRRFIDEFTIPEESIRENKPLDHRKLFEGNTDDMFRLGIKVTRKAVKIFSKYDQSDIIVASALGLRTSIEENLKKDKIDFLSSVEILAIDQADAIAMQNWDHIHFILNHVNHLPADASKCDFSRVRNWYLDENMPYLRQNIVTTSFMFPSVKSLFSKNFQSVQGRVILKPEYTGIISRCSPGATHVFERVDVQSLLQLPEARFAAFMESVLPQLLERHESGTLIFVPSYFDFVKIRNHFEEQNVPFAGLDEYTSTKNISRARTFFQQSKVQILLYSGRLHHFRRFELRGIRRIVFYSVPENPNFYLEMVQSMIKDSHTASQTPALLQCKTVFTKYDSLALERIIGSSRLSAVLKERYQVFEYS